MSQIPPGPPPPAPPARRDIYSRRPAKRIVGAKLRAVPRAKSRHGRRQVFARGRGGDSEFLLCLVQVAIESFCKKLYPPPDKVAVGHIRPVAFKCSLMRTFCQLMTTSLSTRPLSRKGRDGGKEPELIEVESTPGLLRWRFAITTVRTAFL
jgi:hypothetical protein